MPSSSDYVNPYEQLQCTANAYISSNAITLTFTKTSPRGK